MTKLIEDQWLTQAQYDALNYNHTWMLSNLSPSEIREQATTGVESGAMEMFIHGDYKGGGYTLTMLYPVNPLCTDNGYARVSRILHFDSFNMAVLCAANQIVEEDMYDGHGLFKTIRTAYA